MSDASPNAAAALAVRTRLRGEIAALLTRPPEVPIDETTHLHDELGLDSLDLVDLFAAIEDSFGIAIDDRERRSVATVGDLVDLVEAAR